MDDLAKQLVAEVAVLVLGVRRHRGVFSATRCRFCAARPSYCGSLAAKSAPGGSLTRPDSCDSRRRMVTAPMAPGLPLSDNSGIHLTAGSSRSSAPSSRSCMTAVPVMVLVMEAIRCRTAGPEGWPPARSANPAPPDQTSSSPCTTPAAAPYRRLSLTNEATLAPNCSRARRHRFGHEPALPSTMAVTGYWRRRLSAAPDDQLELPDRDYHTLSALMSPTTTSANGLASVPWHLRCSTARAWSGRQWMTLRRRGRTGRLGFVVSSACGCPLAVGSQRRNAQWPPSRQTARRISRAGGVIPTGISTTGSCSSC